MGHWAVVGWGGGLHWGDMTQELREGRVLILPLFILGACSGPGYVFCQGKRPLQFLPLALGCLGLSLSLRLLPSKVHLGSPMLCSMTPVPRAKGWPCPLPSRGEGPQFYVSDQRRVTSPETFISLIHASNKIALHFS